MRLYLDDRRRPPKGFAVARNYGECVLMLAESDVDVLSLDYNLGEQKTGYDVAKWIVDHERWPKIIYLHTSDPVGRDKMYQLLTRYKPKAVSVYPHRIPNN